jgi:hypothetical protein
MTLTPQQQVCHEMVNELEQRIYHWQFELKALEEAETKRPHLQQMVQHAQQEIARLKQGLPVPAPPAPTAVIEVWEGGTAPRQVIRPAGSIAAAPGSQGPAPTVQGQPRR